MSKERIAIYTEEYNSIKKQIKAQTIVIAILIIVNLIICFKAMGLSADYEALNKEKQTLEDLTETQSSMIADLEENCKDLYIEIENLKFGGNE